MDLGSLAIISKFYQNCNDYAKNPTRHKKRVLTRQYKDVITVLRAELHRKSIELEDFDKISNKCKEIFQGVMDNDTSKETSLP